MRAMRANALTGGASDFRIEEIPNRRGAGSQHELGSQNYIPKQHANDISQARGDAAD